MRADHAHIKASIVIYVVHHPDCQPAHQLARLLFRWFRLGDLEGEAAAAGLPVYYRRQLQNDHIHPTIDWDAAELNVIILLADHLMVVDAVWRGAVIKLAEQANQLREEVDRAEQPSEVLLLFEGDV